MDLEIISGENTGKKIWQLDNGAGRALLLAFPGTYKQIEHAGPPPVNKREPRWVVGKHMLNGRAQLLLITPLGEHLPFQGRPEGAVPTFAPMGWKVPADILKQYKNLYAQQPGTYTRDFTDEDQLIREATAYPKATPTPDRTPIVPIKK